MRAYVAMAQSFATADSVAVRRMAFDVADRAELVRFAGDDDALEGALAVQVRPMASDLLCRWRCTPAMAQSFATADTFAARCMAFDVADRAELVRFAGDDGALEGALAVQVRRLA